VLRDRHVPTPPATLRCQFAPQSAFAKYARVAGGPTVDADEAGRAAAPWGGGTNTSWSSSQSATAFARSIAKVEGDEIGRTRQAFDADLYRLHLKAQNQNAIRVSSSQTSGPASCGAG